MAAPDLVRALRATRSGQERARRTPVYAPSAAPPSLPSAATSRSPVGAQNAAQTGLRVLSARLRGLPPRLGAPSQRGAETPLLDPLPASPHRSLIEAPVRHGQGRAIRLSRASTQDPRTSPCDGATRTSTFSLPAKRRGTSPNNRPASRTPTRFAEGGQSAGPDRCGPRSRSRAGDSGARLRHPTTAIGQECG